MLCVSQVYGDWCEIEDLQGDSLEAAYKTPQVDSHTIKVSTGVWCVCEGGVSNQLYLKLYTHQTLTLLKNSYPL